MSAPASGSEGDRLSERLLLLLVAALLCTGVSPAEFPVTAYSGIGHPEHFLEISGGPLTGLIAYAQSLAPSETVRYLHAAEKAGKCAYLQIPIKIVSDLRRVEAFVRSVSKHPGLCGYYASDEPNVRNRVTPGELQALYQTIKRADPSRPVLVAITRSPGGKTADCSTYAASMDVCLWDWYPYQEGSPSPDRVAYKKWREIFHKMRRSAEGMKFWVVYQCTGQFPGQRTTVRWPTPLEFKLQVSSTISHVDGVSCFAWFDARRWSEGENRWNWVHNVFYPGLREALTQRDRADPEN